MLFYSNLVPLAVSLSMLGVASAQSFNSQLGEVMSAFYAADVCVFMSYHSYDAIPTPVDSDRFQAP